MPNADAKRRPSVYSAVKGKLFQDYVRPLLVSGGELPSIKQLSKRYGVSVGTLDKSLQELFVEGYVEKRRGSGTYVLPQAADGQGAVGLLFSCAHSDRLPANEVYYKLDELLQEAVAASGRKCRHYVDMRLAQFKDHPLEQLVDDIERRKISSLVVNGLDERVRPWLEKLKIPVVHSNHDYGWGTVSNDMKADGCEATKILIAKGCKSVELLSSIVHEWETGYNIEVDSINRPLRAGMANALRPLGLRAPECWLTPETLPEPLRHSNSSFSDETKGYELCKALFKAHRPDGLVVFTDVLAKGVLAALAELGLKVGVDVQLAVLGNHELDFPWLEGLVRVDISIKDMAGALLALALAAEMREAPKEIYLKREYWA